MYSTHIVRVELNVYMCEYLIGFDSIQSGCISLWVNFIIFSFACSNMIQFQTFSQKISSSQRDIIVKSW